MLEYILIVLGIVCVVFFVLSNKKSPNTTPANPKLQQIKPVKKSLGEIQVLYASQTGTAAKMASNFAEQASEHGFSGVVINLKDIGHKQFQKNQLSVFFMANTGQGEPPQNSIAFMKMLNGKGDIEGQKPLWQNLNYTVFGLGDTQYQHFNKIGIDTDTLLQKLGGNRIFKIGLGDANSSMQDDYVQWKNSLWPILIQFREKNPYSSQVTQMRKISSHVQQSENNIYLSEKLPIFANYRFCIQKQKKQRKIIENELDFKTKASLLGKMSKIDKIEQKRQNKDEGSSLQLEVHLQGQPQYETASNIALWPTNDPIIIKEVLSYFKLNENDYIDVQTIDNNKQTKYNFISPLSIQQLLEQYVDLQFRVTKGMLKKLSKFQSKSPEYFLTNSSPKTTEQFKRLSENQKQFNYLFKLVKQFQVKLTFEDFIELSDSMGPRLFTIASSWKAQKNVAIVASLVNDGLISKHFLRNPQFFKAQLRKSSFSNIQKWKKVIFIGAGTGFAPFRGYLQEKQLALKQNRNYPIISLYFGCRKSNSDFIYKQEILEWQKQNVINKLHLAFSRETQKKVYVQNLLQEQKQQLIQFIKDPQTAMYICGALAMGKDVVEAIERNSKQYIEDFKKQLTQWQKSGKLIKQLW